MSRRTKLIIAALFLVLVGIPVGYIVISWSPANPLEFRLVQLPKKYDPFNPASGFMVVEMRNISIVPVHTYEAQVHLPGTRDYAAIDVYRQAPLDASRTLSGTLALQPGEARRCSGRVLYEVATAQGYDGAVVQCKWISETKWKGYRIAYWLYTHLPKPINNWFSPPEDEITLSPLLN